MPILDGLVDEVVFRNEENGWTVLTVKPEKGDFRLRASLCTRMLTLGITSFLSQILSLIHI